MSTQCQSVSSCHGHDHAMTRPHQWASLCHGHGCAVSRPCQQASPTAETWDIRGLFWIIQKSTFNIVYKISYVEK
jgi:hypothetical protein